MGKNFDNKSSAEKYLEEEVIRTVYLFLPLFPINENDLQGYEKPTVLIDDDSDYQRSGYYSNENSIYFAKEDTITNHSIGEYVGDWLYHNVNPSIFKEKRKNFEKIIDNENFGESARRYFAGLDLGYYILFDIVPYYCGLYNNERGNFQSPSTQDVLETITSMEAEGFGNRSFGRGAIAVQYALLKTRRLATLLYERHDTQEFRLLTGMTLKDAQKKIKLLTGYDILDLE
ncbi:MAG: hypothetical protein RL557_987 [archaeon]|jgi:hypothetical protein